MEEFEKRRERLKAMRMVAAEAEASNTVDASAVQNSGLVNPLIDTPATGKEESGVTPRFDFYTDPMAAFIGNKKKSVAANSNSSAPMLPYSFPRTGPSNLEMTPFSAYQMQSDYSPDQRMYQAEGHYQNAPPYKSPSDIRGHLPMFQGTPPEAWNRTAGTPSYFNSDPHRGKTSPYTMHQADPGFGAVGRPSFNYGLGRAHGPGNRHLFGSGRGGNQASGLGRGQGQWRGGRMNPSVRRSGGRGQVFQYRGYVPEETLGPENFYHQSMIEDPWQHLEPVLWRVLDAPTNNLNAPSSSNSWLPKSVSIKKPRVSEPANKSSPEQSLAEYLAASFNETVNDGSNV